MKYKNGDVYEGTFKQGKKHGNDCVYLFKTTERVYKGNFENDKIQGQGTMTISEGLMIYEGEFSNSLYHGQGIMTYQNGMRYEGEWY